jgi:hypothetical protein
LARCLPPYSPPAVLATNVLEYNMGKGGDAMRVEVESVAREALLDAAVGRRPASRGATAMAGEHVRCEVPLTVAMLPPSHRMM